MFDFIKDLFGREPKSADLLTLHFLARRIYIQYAGCSFAKADRLATKKVSEWLLKGETDRALKELWRRKKIA